MLHKSVVNHAIIVLLKQIRHHVCNLMSHATETILAGKHLFARISARVRANATGREYVTNQVYA
jgi:hypothetical protein